MLSPNIDNAKRAMAACPDSPSGLSQFCGVYPNLAGNEGFSFACYRPHIAIESSFFNK